MKKGWKTIELAAVSSINYGYTTSASSEPIGPRFLRITDIQNECVDWNAVPYCKIEFPDLLKFRLASGDIVFARTGATTGKSFLVEDPPDAVFASYLIRLRLLDEILLPQFVLMYFQTADYWQSIKDGSSGSTQGGFNATKLGALKIPLPPLPEQQRIVALLDEAFAGLATAKANAERNLKNARAIFESHLQSVFSQRGEGWVEKRLECLAEIRTGKRDANHQDENGPYPFYTCAFGQFKSPTFSFDGPSIILPGNGANVGKIFFYNGKFEAYQRTYVVNELNYSVIPRFLYFCFTANWSRWIATKQFGSATNYIVVGDLKGFPVPMPPLEVQEVTVEQLELFTEETQHLTRLYERKLAALEELKRALLHQAFNGEL
ncbi:MAG: Type restriction enzyme EcoKI specificity protein [Cyanobacteriota bacterium]|jgi:type I restriction enzyme S subunit